MAHLQKCPFFGINKFIGTTLIHCHKAESSLKHEYTERNTVNHVKTTDHCFQMITIAIQRENSNNDVNYANWSRDSSDESLGYSESTRA